MQTFIVRRDNDFDIRFTGKKLASVSSHRESAKRWTELNLYQTEKGQYVAEQIGFTTEKNEKELRSGAVCQTMNDVAKFFGFGKLAIRLYDAVKIQPIQDIE